MAHHFETGVFYGEKPWHGLGTTLADDDARRRSIVGTLEAAGLDWRVDRHPLAVAGGPYDGAAVPDRYAIVRESDAAVLGTVGERYQCLQNADMFRWFEPFLESGAASFETAGSLMGGRVVWILAKLADVPDGDTGGGDTVRPYLMLTSSHDGSLATRAGFCPIRTVCWNTLSLNLGHAKSQLIKVRHTKSQSESLELIRQTVDTVQCQFNATLAQYQRLRQLRISEADLQRYVRVVLELPEDGPVPTRSANTVRDIVGLAIGGIGQDGSRTAWSAYNGVTEWLSHRAGRSANNRLASVWTGTGANMNARALELALQLGA